jgi:DNA-binding transcriptional ArsR family regulator
MDAALQAIAEPRRREILTLIWSRELPAGRIASQFEGEVTRPAISQHLRVLKDAGLIDERREGTRRYYRARPEGLAEMREFFESLWDGGLERLKAAAERETRKEKLRDASNRLNHD